MEAVQTLYSIAKRQRLLWSSAIVVALTLVWIAHAPVLPVMAGCVLAIIITALRSWPVNPKRPWQK